MVLAGAVLPGIVRAFNQDRPKVVIRIRDTPVDALVDRVVAGDIDLAVGPDRPGLDGVVATPAFDSPWVLWCASDHALAKRKTLRWNDLRDVTLVAAGRDHERSVAQMHVNAPEGSRIHPVDVVDNLRARQIQTQSRVLLRTLTFFVLLIGAAAMLMTFPGARQFGASLLASAGLAGLAVGFAASAPDIAAEQRSAALHRRPCRPRRPACAPATAGRLRSFRFPVPGAG